MPLPFISMRRPDGSPVTWTGPLAALLYDAGAITPEQWRAYLRTGDAAELPECPASITVRPLGAGHEVAECEAEAGPADALGAFLLGRVAADAAALPEAGRPEAQARAIAALPEADREAVARYQGHAQRVQRARLSRCLLAIDGETRVRVADGSLVSPLEALGHLPHGVYLLALIEVEQHARRIGTLGAAGK